MKKNLVVSVSLVIFSVQVYSQWIPLNVDTTFSLNSVYFLNKDTGYVAGETYPQGIVLKTQDGGMTWDTAYTSNTTFHMTVHAPTDSVIYFGGEDGDVNKSVDSGQTWNQLLPVN